MEITEVRIKLAENTDDRLKAFCSITFDHCFVVRDIKIIEGASGIFVSMPSRKLTFPCPQCRCKNHVLAQYCNQCGTALPDRPIPRDAHGRQRLHADIAHPINARCREMIEKRVLAAFENEKIQAQQPGYRSRYDEAYGDVVPLSDAGPEGAAEEVSAEPAGQRHRHRPPRPHWRERAGRAAKDIQSTASPAPHTPSQPTSDSAVNESTPGTPPPTPPTRPNSSHLHRANE